MENDEEREYGSRRVQEEAVVAATTMEETEEGERERERGMREGLR